MKDIGDIVHELQNVVDDLDTLDSKRQEKDRDKIRASLRSADAMARAIDEATRQGSLGARTKIADARLDYGTPWQYESD